MHDSTTNFPGSLVTSSLIRETTENESANYGYKFGQEEETYNIVAAHGYFGRLIFQYASFNNSRGGLPFGGISHSYCMSTSVHNFLTPKDESLADDLNTKRQCCPPLPLRHDNK
jgi:hypothetical protein